LIQSSTALNKLGGETVVSSEARTGTLTGCEDVAEELLRETLKENYWGGGYRSAVIYLILLK